MKNSDFSTTTAISFILKMASSYPVSIGIMFLTGIVWAIELSLSPYVLKIILNKVSTVSPETIFSSLTIPIICYLLLGFTATTTFRLYGYFVEIKMIPYLRKKIASLSFEHLLKQSQTYYQNNFSGSLASKIDNLVSGIPDILQITIDRFFSHALALLIAIYALWHVNIKFALAMLGWTTFFTIVSFFLGKRLVNLSDALSHWGATITGKFVDALSNILSVRLFARQKAEKATMNAAFDRAIHLEQKLEWSYFWIWLCYSYSFLMIQALNLYLLVKGRQEGWITIGDFALVLGINISIVDVLWQVTRDFSQFSKVLGRVTQAIRTIFTEPTLQDSKDAKPLIISKGEIVFDNVQFNYTLTDRVLSNISFRIPPGQKVGLVGYSGEGKTTLVNLILRLFDATSGKILIDGQDIREATQASLHQHIAMIPQEPSLFHRTLMENIRYGRLDASDEEVIAASKKAFAHEFIEKLPQGYDSLVGERGVKLSGGQRQRIAIARAILKNAPILILDEATSQLDSVIEHEIQNSLWELMQNKTTLVIAHRLSTLSFMDRILVIDQGEIVEDGTHEELLAQNGLYKTLWDAQVGGFLPSQRA